VSCDGTSGDAHPVRQARAVEAHADHGWRRGHNQGNADGRPLEVGRAPRSWRPDRRSSRGTCKIHWGYAAAGGANGLSEGAGSMRGGIVGDRLVVDAGI
jgi:hypothetical protein